MVSVMSETSVITFFFWKIKATRFFLKGPKLFEGGWE